MRDFERGITQEFVKSLWFYDGHSGLFFWKKTVSPANRKGHPAGKRTRYEYRLLTIKRVNYAAHRIAWLYVYGYLPLPPLVIDHINGNRGDNRISNLRLADRAQNCMNARPHGRGLKGVTLHASGRWQAHITIRGKPTFLGLHDTAEQAHAAYMAKATEAFGEFARAL